ncbi:hypothetical protein SteCoe_13812 [Stentor coeruleus]|uniref:Armadillo repeat-containing domain-containing protein n=1 Tax=Stentor coeruleus TaxID=5963 RepID=A0A1R2C7J4_9CILI|nr:hypothetical protein SteCoe_13812 [Stentor coeruleus]
MGCCQGREEEMRKIKIIKPDDEPSDEEKPTTKDEPLKTTDSTTSGLATEPLNYGKKHLLNYLDFCKTQKNYEQLVGLINDNTEIKNPKAYISWAEKPRSIGSLALVYLCQLCQKDQENVAKAIEPSLHMLMEYMKNGSEDLRDNSLMLMYYALDFTSEESVAKLVEQGVFSILMRSIMCSKEELRHLTASVCYKIYKNRPYAQRLFIDMKGGRQLVQQISWSSENDSVLRSLLDYLAELLQDKDDKVMQEYIVKLNEERAIDIIRDISNADKSADTLVAMDYLIDLLTSDDNKD